MNDVLFIVKTKRFSSDRRVHKQIKSFNEKGCKVQALVSSEDDFVEKEYGLKKVTRICHLGKAADRSFLKRYLGAIHFSFNAFIKARSFKGTIVVADPVLFLLTFLLCKFSSSKVVWDHHELPPDFFLGFGILRYLFKKAYEMPEVVIHANDHRRLYLESRIGTSHPNSHIVSNFPERKGNVEDINCIRDSVLDAAKGSFVYLQNVTGSSRADVEIFRALKISKVHAVYAGSIEQERLTLLRKEIADFDSFCTFVGVLEPYEIDYLLVRSLGTVVFYKKTSQNNWLCDPTRLYQAMKSGIPIVAGNNPTIVEVLSGYPRAFISDTDGSDVVEIADKISLMKGITKDTPLNKSKNFKALFWDDCNNWSDEVINSIIF